MNRSHIVVGLGYGDEGKGITTDFLTQRAENPLVIRSTGGHQAGHNVVSQGKQHVFSSFGAGTLSGAPSYWSKNCTFSPSNLLLEWEHLKELGITPKLFVDALAPVTTPFDVYANQYDIANVRHSTVGMGFGKTIERHESAYKLYVQDLFFPHVLLEKLHNIMAYYKLGIENDVTSKMIGKFLEECGKACTLIKMVNEEEFFMEAFSTYSDFIFEGSQGILLDKDFGFFPHVTRGNTTSKNAIELIRRNSLPEPELYYVTRAYQTRHGNGPMQNEAYQPNLGREITEEINKSEGWQGEFRKGILDIPTLKYAFACDKNFSGAYKKNLVVTCMDQLRERGIIEYTNPGIKRGSIRSLLRELEVSLERVYASSSTDSSSMRVLIDNVVEREVSEA